MREILFRGKRIDNREWIYGNLLVYPSGICKICVTTSKKPIYGQLEEVIPESVGQYTGLTDKNGTKIFEGDIVQIWMAEDDESEKYKAVIEFGNPNGRYDWGYQLKMIDDMLYNNDILLWVEMEETGAFTEVIGNIHDNPELSEATNGYKD